VDGGFAPLFTGEVFFLIAPLNFADSRKATGVVKQVYRRRCGCGAGSGPNRAQL